MKLRNKKTGEILGSLGSFIIQNPNHINCETITKYNSLAELNEEWEDYKEQCWYITPTGEVREGELDVDWRDERRIGNYFESKEEAEKAVEKLKAWKRLKDKGFEFDGWKRDERYYGDFTITATDQISCDDKDLELLFGGEE